ncbi:reverse transcriptase/maturase family protein [Vibrio cyclitrophicus]|uniref:reverse transcriptase/maturase family protein n=1 Tax=Vibrio cyclitrophicus TaxID=47951 RepID=UPI000316B66A|nr:RNA-dependent DNA polymerase [Vibrio cyclitrophicus]OEF47851.1 RNA-dependent DNA polymerase [Vibrio cyclitrophicus 1F273]
MYEEIVSFDNLMLAASEAAKGKRYKAPIMSYMANVEENVINTQNHLVWGSYTPSPHRQFFVFEPKKRLISAPPFADRVVHHAIHKVVEPVIDKRFIHDSYACRAGKGTHKGVSRAQKFMRIVKRNHGRVYVFKADISKYFDSINHNTLKHILSRHINCPRTYSLLCAIVDGPNPKSERLGVGIPIGNLTSQLFANLYLNELDQYVKHSLREKYYIRYMDDFVIIHHDKAHLQRVRADVERWLFENLQLKTNHKTQVFPVSKHRGRSLDFLGYRLYTTHKLMRKCTEKRMRYKIKRLREKYEEGLISQEEVRSVIASYVGCAKHASAHGLLTRVLQKPFTRKCKDECI